VLDALTVGGFTQADSLGFTLTASVVLMTAVAPKVSTAELITMDQVIDPPAAHANRRIHAMDEAQNLLRTPIML
jgi:hypothetical protein